MKKKLSFLEKIGFRLSGIDVQETTEITRTLKLFFSEDVVHLKIGEPGDTSYIELKKADARYLAREIAKFYGPGPGWQLSSNVSGVAK